MYTANANRFFLPSISAADYLILLISSQAWIEYQRIKETDHTVHLPNVKLVTGKFKLAGYKSMDAHKTKGAYMYQ